MDRFPESSSRQLSRSKVVCVGASGGQGLEDLLELLGALRGRLDAILLVTLHRPVGVPSFLRQILQRGSAGPVTIAQDGERLVPGTCYIGEPDQHLTLAPGRHAALIRDADHVLRNRTIDALFVSVAHHAAELGTGIILSGSLSDGSAGSTAIRAAGGTLMAVSPSSNVWSDMPRNAIARVGSPDAVDGIAGLAAHLGRAEVAPGAVRHRWRDGAPFPLSRILHASPATERPPEPGQDGLAWLKPPPGHAT